MLRRELHALDDLFHNVCRAERTRQPESFKSGTVFPDRTKGCIHRENDATAHVLIIEKKRKKNT